MYRYRLSACRFSEAEPKQSARSEEFAASDDGDGVVEIAGKPREIQFDLGDHHPRNQWAPSGTSEMAVNTGALTTAFHDIVTIWPMWQWCSPGRTRNVEAADVFALVRATCFCTMLSTPTWTDFRTRAHRSSILSSAPCQQASVSGVSPIPMRSHVSRSLIRSKLVTHCARSFAKRAGLRKTGPICWPLISCAIPVVVWKSGRGTTAWQPKRSRAASAKCLASLRRRFAWKFGHEAR